jgi:Zn-dependent protease
MFDETFILRIPAILLALTIHECAHGVVALHFGDTTARDAGRLTLNPFAHLDIFGTIMLLVGPFGWAKPVPVNAYNLARPKRDILLVSLAGPVSNILSAIAAGYVLRIIAACGPAALHDRYIFNFFNIFIILNIGLAFFNFIPVPPLDGSKILASLLPNHLIPFYFEKLRFLPFVFMAMLALEWGLHIPLFSTIMDPLFKPFASLCYFIIGPLPG